MTVTNLTNRENSKMHDSFKLLGCPVRDRVTGIAGIADSICFDLYGCIQASIRPEGKNEKGEPFVAHWYDVKRLEVTGGPVMSAPDFSKPEIGSADKATR